MHRILLIEDDELLREGLRQVLEEDGCSVAAAADGASGMELLREGEMSPCLILLDLMMPGMNGWDFLQLHGRHPTFSKIPIAVASAYPFGEKEVSPGIVLRKPFSPARLKQLISDHCLCGDGAAGQPKTHRPVPSSS
jgi:CheY-like chemotaxis protein